MAACGWVIALLTGLFNGVKLWVVPDQRGSYLLADAVTSCPRG